MSDVRSFQLEVLDHTLHLETRPGLPGWRKPERGRLLLLETMEIDPTDKVLELACSYGACGLVAALLAEQNQVTLADDDAMSIECVRANMRRNQIENASVLLTADYGDLPAGAYDVVLLHAPAYRGNALVRYLIQVAQRSLRPGGRFYLSGGKKEGLDTFRREVATLFDTVEVVARGGGKQVLLAVKGDRDREERLLAAAEFEVSLRGHHFRFRSRPGVFAHGKVDAASRLLLEVVEIGPAAEILDLGCGYGLLGIVAAKLAPQGRVVLVDRSMPAVESARENLELNGVTNAETMVGDGVEPVRGRRFDLVLCNPPFHAGRPADRAIGEKLIREGASVLDPGGRLYVVCSEFLPYERVMEQALGPVVEVTRQGGFKVLLAERSPVVG